jgi:hypothetical protein
LFFFSLIIAILVFGGWEFNYVVLTSLFFFY